MCERSRYSLRSRAGVSPSTIPDKLRLSRNAAAKRRQNDSARRPKAAVCLTCIGEFGEDVVRHPNT